MPLFTLLPPLLVRKLLGEPEVSHLLKALVDNPVLKRAWEVRVTSSFSLWYSSHYFASFVGWEMLICFRNILQNAKCVSYKRCSLYTFYGEHIVLKLTILEHVNAAVLAWRWRRGRCQDVAMESSRRWRHWNGCQVQEGGRNVPRGSGCFYCLIYYMP